MRLQGPAATSRDGALDRRYSISGTIRIVPSPGREEHGLGSEESGTSARAQASWSMAALRPFQRPPFRQVPAAPRRPHTMERLAPTKVPIRVAGETLTARVFVGGDGSPLLLVHGLMTTSYSWRYVAGPLIDAGFRVIAPDLPGAGETPALRGGCSAKALTEAIAALLRAMGLRGCAVVGNSMGGYLAMRLALRDPDAMGRLCNLHSPGVPLRRLYLLHALLRTSWGPRVLDYLVARDPDRWVWRNVHYADETLKSHEELCEYAAPLRTRAGRAAFVSWLRDGLDPRVMAETLAGLDATPQFPVPLQLIYSRQDPMVPPSVGVRLAHALPDAQMVWLEDSSHFAHVDTPQQFLDAAMPFLRE